jgi:SAM-dependent methyltransferase
VDQRTRLHLGCGSKILDGYVNVDIVPGPGVDLVCDIGQGIPLETGRFEEVLAVDFLEHIPPPRTIFVMNEIHRVLRPGGVLRAHVPEAPGITAFQDPTHQSFWNSETFTYFVAGHHRREVYGTSYGVTAAFELRQLKRRRHKWKRFFATGNPSWLSNFVLDVELVAVDLPTR